MEDELINYYHGTYKDYEYVVFYFEQGYMQHFCGYVKVPDDHPELRKLEKRSWFNLGATARSLVKFTKGKPNEFLQKYLEKSSLDKRYYKNNYEDIDVNVHGGLTFGDQVTKYNIDDWQQPFTLGWWIGWDYSHAGDEINLPPERIIDKSERIQQLYTEIMAIGREFSPSIADKQWTFEEVETDCKSVIDQLIQLQ